MTQKEKEYKAAVEAILFAHGDAIGADKIAEALEISKDQTVACASCPWATNGRWPPKPPRRSR